MNCILNTEIMLPKKHLAQGRKIRHPSQGFNFLEFFKILPKKSIRNFLGMSDVFRDKIEVRDRSNFGVWRWDRCLLTLWDVLK